MPSRTKVSKTCPICGKVVLVDPRSETCSVSCGIKLRSQRWAEKGQAVIENKAETHSVSGDTWEISIPRSRIRTLDDLIREFQIDLSVWTVEKFIANKWEIGAKDAEGNISVEPLYQVKAWLRRNRDLEFIRREIEAMKKAASKWAPKAFAKAPDSNRGNLLEISISDLHVGRYAWGEGTGYGDYDSRIAINRMREAVADILVKAAPYKLERVLLIVGNDLFNIDRLDNTTTAGTRQDTDTRYQKLFAAVREAYVETVGACLKSYPVDVVIVPGNHDTLTSWHLGESLALWFRNTEGVTVDNAPVSRKYYQWGRVGLMFCHGDKGKRINYPMVFASERPDIFSSSIWKEVHVGHWHHMIVEDRFGVIVRVLPTLASQSHWEAENMYIGAVRAAEGFIWNREAGLIGSVVYSVPNERGGSKNAAVA
jgi:hypothetical protein